MRYVAYATAIVVGAGTFAAAVAVCAYEYSLWTIAIAAAAVVMLPVASLIHETGHKTLGLFFSVSAKMRLSLFGASWCEISPKKSSGLKTRIVWTALGGEIFNFLLLALGVVAMCVPAVPLWLCFLLPADAYLFVLNAFPATMPDGDTDTAFIASIVSGDDEGKVSLAVLEAAARLNEGEKIEDLEESLLFDLPQIREDSEAFIQLERLRADWLEAKGDERAEAFRERAKELEIYES